MREIAVVIASLAFLGAFALALAWRQARVVVQPVAYNHQKHLELGLECSHCHSGIAESAARARLPGLDTCLACHGADDENPKSKVLQEYAAKGSPVPWVKVTNVPDHVRFSHRRHAASGGLDCALCHGDMSKKAEPVTETAVPVTMGRCMACHRERGVTNDCLACHR